MSVSIVQYFGEQSSKCGYCTGTDCNKSHGMHAYRLDCTDYQELIDRGWRRCGNYCYKPQNDITCCPCYTIKCNAQEFKLSKSNKRILRRMNKFLRDGKCESSDGVPSKQGAKDGNGDDVDIEVNAAEPQPQLPDNKPSVIDIDRVETLFKTQAEVLKNEVQTPANAEQLIALPTNNKPVLDNSKAPPRKKAKQLRLERRLAKYGVLEQAQAKKVNEEKNLRDFLYSTCETDKHKLKIVMVAASDTQHTCADEVHALYRKYQILIHNDSPAGVTLAKMQRFLVKSPLKLGKTQDGPEMGYGSFHQQYWLDEKLIAVGVIDILPGSISSVYFFYDPDYSFLSLGTYGSLREIDLVQTIAESVPALKYYYMGFYIHNCPKMRYKGKLPASYLLCPETYVWMPLTDEIRDKLSAKKYQRINSDATAKDENEFLLQHLNDVKLLIDAQTSITYRQLLQLTGNSAGRDMIIEYGKLVGKVCAQRMLYVHMS
ncbi:arginyl-tRNA--protein transferase 1 isoform X2 [Drosophila busckii]|uniref:arginyl-tRNA--protein transferase 1 isoform X2 n=1 Tax=Drosophila busckii TaxID=30019 RepID=UPI00083F0CB7|nr:arginyl-tRNA--protein transferase 1 isoform X2 [Drosophila busckii]